MVRNLAIILIPFVLISCETTSSIDKYHSSVKQVFIDVVKKDIFEDKLAIRGKYSNKAKKLFKNWLETGIKTNGFDGEVDIHLLSIISEEILIDNGVRINIDAKIELLISKSALDSKRLIELNGSEFGELTGQFSINDKSVLAENIIKKLIERFSNKLSSEVN
ncbi:MAG: hypothetical protein CMI90_00295 [Pelagibacteraceae bacterium]|nr:hypothetical protein [Pelagibacteraceae bacterium]